MGGSLEGGGLIRSEDGWQQLGPSLLLDRYVEVPVGEKVIHCGQQVLIGKSRPEEFWPEDRIGPDRKRMRRSRSAPISCYRAFL